MCTVHFAYMPSPIPRQDEWNLLARTIPSHFGLPWNRGGSAPASLFSESAQRSHSHYGLHARQIAFATSLR